MKKTKKNKENTEDYFSESIRKRNILYDCLDLHLKFTKEEFYDNEKLFLLRNISILSGFFLWAMTFFTKIGSVEYSFLVSAGAIFLAMSIPLVPITINKDKRIKKLLNDLTNCIFAKDKEE